MNLTHHCCSFQVICSTSCCKYTDLGSFLSQLQLIWIDVRCGRAWQQKALEDAFLCLGNHQLLQHGEGSGAHVWAWCMGEVLPQESEGP